MSSSFVPSPVTPVISPQEKLRISAVSLFPVAVLFIVMMIALYSARRGALMNNAIGDIAFWILSLGAAFGLNLGAMYINYPKSFHLDEK